MSGIFINYRQRTPLATTSVMYGIRKWLDVADRGALHRAG